jgi:hypothetical protein
VHHKVEADSRHRDRDIILTAAERSFLHREDEVAHHRVQDESEVYALWLSSDSVGSLGNASS